MRVPFLDFERQPDTHDALVKAAERVIRSGRYIGGTEVESIESRVADYCGIHHAIGTSSGTDALLVTLMALGIGPGDEVIVPDFTFVSPASCVLRLGATPVFVDIDADSFNMLPQAAETAITDRTAAILVVHLFGQLADMERLNAIAHRHGIPIVEDAAQAIGAFQRGEHAGGFGIAGCFSFYPTKNLGACGDAGMVVTNDDSLAGRVRLLRNHGASPKYHYPYLGGNFRLDALQAAFLNVRMDTLEDETRARIRNAEHYMNRLSDANLVLPAIKRYNDRHTFHQFCVRLNDRERVRDALSNAGVDTQIYYPEVLSEQPAFDNARARSTPEAHLTATQILALPIFGDLRSEELDYVCDVILKNA